MKSFELEIKFRKTYYDDNIDNYIMWSYNPFINIKIGYIKSGLIKIVLLLIIII
jgi:hypothetical protein